MWCVRLAVQLVSVTGVLMVQVTCIRDDCTMWCVRLAVQLVSVTGVLMVQVTCIQG